MEGPRVVLRPYRDDDMPVMEALLPQSDDDAEVLTICRAGEDDRSIGILEYALGEPSEGWATVKWVALVDGERRWGLGQDAVRLFEEEARRCGVRAFRTRVPASLGLALYFWLRLGYRPLDVRGNAVLEMVREVG